MASHLIIFNIDTELCRVVKSLEQNNNNNNYKFHISIDRQHHSNSKTEEAVQNMLNMVGERTEWLSLKFNANKFATLHVDYRKKRETQETLFTIQRE